MRQLAGALAVAATFALAPNAYAGFYDTFGVNGTVFMSLSPLSDRYQNATRAPPGSFSGGRSTIAEKSQRSRGNMEGDVVVMGQSLRYPATIKRNRLAIHRGHAMSSSATSSRPSPPRIAYAHSNASLHKAEEGWT